MLGFAFGFFDVAVRTQRLVSAPAPTIHNTTGGDSRPAGGIAGFAARANAIAARVAALEI